MSTSGSSDFSITRNEILSEAFELGGIVRAGTALSSAQLTKGNRVLNAMVKNWQVAGIRMWTVTEAVLIPQSEQIQFQLGTGSSDHATLMSDLVRTTLSADEANGQTSLSVTSDDDIADNDYIAVQLDDGTFHFSQVNGTPAGDVVAMDDALPDSASEGAQVLCYTTKLVRPLKIPSIRRRDMTSGYDTPLRPLARLDYQSLSNKQSEGQPSAYFYDPQLTFGLLNIYQRETALTCFLPMTVHRPIEDFDTAADNPDLPQGWIKALNYGLARDLGDSFDIPPQRYQRIVAQFTETIAMLTGDDREEASLCIEPDFGP